MLSYDSCVNYIIVQWNLEDLGIMNMTFLKSDLSGFFTLLLYQVKENKKYKELGLANLHCYKRVLLYISNLFIMSFHYTCIYHSSPQRYGKSL